MEKHISQFNNFDNNKLSISIFVNNLSARIGRLRTLPWSHKTTIYLKYSLIESETLKVVRRSGGRN